MYHTYNGTETRGLAILHNIVYQGLSYRTRFQLEFEETRKVTQTSAGWALVRRVDDRIINVQLETHHEESETLLQFQQLQDRIETWARARGAELGLERKESGSCVVQ